MRKTATFALNSQFAESVRGKALVVHVTHFAEPSLKWRLLVNDSGEPELVRDLVEGGDGTWHTSTFRIPEAASSAALVRELTIDVLAGEPIVHMIEVTRAGSE